MSTLNGTGYFSDDTINNGVVTAAVFDGNASNSGEIAETAIFQGNAVNTGTVAKAEFYGNAINSGIVSVSAVFADSSTNGGTIQGDAIFRDTATSNGTVLGDAQVAATVTVGQNATYANTPSVYVQPDGAFTNAYYSGGIKAAPTGYQFTAFETGLVWTVYNSSGTGSVANGVYTDGTLLNANHYNYYNFNVGINQSTACVAWVVTNDTNNGQLFTTSSTTPTSAVVYTDKTLTTTYNNGSFSFNGNDYTTDGSGLASVVVVSNWYDDASTSAKAVTLNGVTQFNEGGGVKGALFNGSSGYLQIPASSGDFDFGTGDFTVECMVKSSSSDTNKFLFLRNNYYYGWLLRTNPNDGSKIQLHTADIDQLELDLDSTTSFNDGNWHHVAMVRSNGVSTLYIDGQAEISSPDTRNIEATGQYFVDLFIGGFTSSGYTLNGKLAAIRIVKGSAIYTSNFSVPTTLPTNVSGTVLLLNFGATDVPVVLDLVDGSATPQLVTKQGNVTRRVGGGINLDGSAYLTVDSPADSTTDISLGDFTVEFNVYWNSTPTGHGGIISRNYPGQDARASLMLMTDTGAGAGKLACLFSTNGSTWGYVVGTEVKPIQGEWYHIAITRDSTSLKLWVDGEMAGSVSIDPEIELYNTSQQWGIGTYSDFGGARKSLNGSISNLRIVKGTAIYTSNFNIPTSIPTAVSGTGLLLNFGSTTIPTNWFDSLDWYGDKTETYTMQYSGDNVRTLNIVDGVSGLYCSGRMGGYYSTDLLNLGTDDFTIETWIKPGQGSSYVGEPDVHGATLIAFSDGTLNHGWALSISQSWIYAGSFQSQAKLNANEWYHVAITKTNGKIQTWLDGVLDNEQNWSDSVEANISTGGITTIGYNNLVGPWQPSNYPYLGIMAGLRVVKGTAIYTSTFTPPTNVLTNISGTELLLTFNSTTSPTKTYRTIQASSACSNGGPVTVYVGPTEHILQVGVDVFTDTALTTPVTDGLFVIDGTKYSTVNGVITSVDACGYGE